LHPKYKCMLSKSKIGKLKRDLKTLKVTQDEMITEIGKTVDCSLPTLQGILNGKIVNKKILKKLIEIRNRGVADLQKLESTI